MRKRKETSERRRGERRGRKEVKEREQATHPSIYICRKEGKRRKKKRNKTRRRENKRIGNTHPSIYIYLSFYFLFIYVSNVANLSFLHMFLYINYTPESINICPYSPSQTS